MKKLLTCFLAVLVFACEPAAEQTNGEEAPQSQYSIAADSYAETQAKAFDHFFAFEWDAWAALLADDVQYQFPNGDEDTRTKLSGKEEVVNFWKNWQANSGVKSMAYRLPVHVPIQSNETLQMTGLAGNYVLSFLSVNVDFDNERTARVRMNYSTHYNDNGLIDRIYTYYDRSVFIEAMDEDILAKE